MKIAILQDDFPPHHEGGSGVIAYQLARAFARAGDSVLVLTAVETPEAAGETVEEGVEIIRLFSRYHPRYRAYRSLYNPVLVKEVRKHLRNFGPDIVHVHNVHTHLSYYCVAVARRYAHRVIMTAHDAMSFYFGKPPFTTVDFAGPPDPNIFKESYRRQFNLYRLRFNPLRTPLIRKILRRNLDAIVAVSYALKRALETNGYERIHVIHNGIEASEWDRPNGVEDFKKEKGIRECATLFGGRLSEAKGAYKMIEALALVSKKIPQAQLLIIGRKNFQGEALCQYAEELGVEDRLIFTGWLSGDELRKAYHSAALVAVPSLYLDPFPTINLEAFACGKAVVSTAFGGSPEIVRNGENGYVVDPRDASSLADALCGLLSDPEKSARFGEAGRALVLKEFSLQSQINAYQKLFNENLR